MGIEKKILIGISGSIAAYKTALLTRFFIKEGWEVKVIMTDSAKDFISPLTLATLSKNRVYSEFYDASTGAWANHVELGLWADVMVIAPATANTLAKMANGICDNLLLATYLSAKCPVYIAPAMDRDMYQHASTQKNLNTLQSYGVKLIAPESGELASGLIGEGRMAEPEFIFNAIKEAIQGATHSNNPLRGKRVLVTAGPTYEAIDPVRFIGNHSSGKMGFALADELALRGAEVVLITGPTDQTSAVAGIQRIDVVSAKDMLAACLQEFENVSIAIMAAAVADYTLLDPASQKLKKKTDSLQLNLVPTTDILATMGKRKKDDQLLVGFALETSNDINLAIDKLTRKNLDLIVFNSLADAHAGFKGDTNKITLVDSKHNVVKFELKSKREVAKDIVGFVMKHLPEQSL